MTPYKNKNNKLLILKAGSSLTTSSSGKLNLKFIKSISEQIFKLRRTGFNVVLVSSGAIAQGIKIWNLKEKPKKIDMLQALSASGQIDLINSYQKQFKRFNLIAAQVLLSHSDFKDKERSTNAKTSLYNLIQLGAVPIINENDSISTEEIKNGDNDKLSGKVASLLDAKKLIIMTDQNGVYEENPNQNKNAKLLKKVALKNFSYSRDSFGNTGVFGRGGMTTKLEAAKDFLKKGKEAWIVNGNEKNVLLSLIKNGNTGTKIVSS